MTDEKGRRRMHPPVDLGTALPSPPSARPNSRDPRPLNCARTPNMQKIKSDNPGSNRGPRDDRYRVEDG